MEIKPIQEEDIENCAKLIIRAYNGPPWNYQWTVSKATSYINELFGSSRFVGYCIYEGDELAAAMLCHVKTWWIDDQLMIDELFVANQQQGRGYGQALINAARQYATDNNLGSITLITNKFMPAMSFYKKNAFLPAEQFILMFNEI